MNEISLMNNGKQARARDDEDIRMKCCRWSRGWRFEEHDKCIVGGRREDCWYRFLRGSSSAKELGKVKPKAKAWEAPVYAGTFLRSLCFTVIIFFLFHSSSDFNIEISILCKRSPEWTLQIMEQFYCSSWKCGIRNTDFIDEAEIKDDFSNVRLRFGASK